jgi:hypothetical protein
MEHVIRVNGMWTLIKDRARVFRSGRTEVSMRGTGWTTKLTGKGDWYMLMAMFMSEAGSKTKQRAMESTNTLMVLCTRVNGSSTNSMVRARSAGQIKLHTRGITKTAKSTAMVLSSGLMVRSTRENLKKTISKDWVFTSGLMGVYSAECGSITRCMVMACSRGLMGGGTMEATCKTRSRDMELSSGLTAKSTLATGLTAGNTVVDTISWRLDKNARASGKKARGSSGPMKID